MRVVWLLDFDGVINGMGRCGWSSSPRHATAYAFGRGWRIRWAPQLIARINAVHASGLVDIRWATTWVEGGTDQIERITGLRHFEHAYTWPRGTLTHANLKLLAACDIADAGGRLIWTDDEIIPSAGSGDRLALDAAGALLISPDERRGLRPEDLDLIEAYVSGDRTAREG